MQNDGVKNVSFSPDFENTWLFADIAKFQIDKIEIKENNECILEIF